MCNYSVYSGLLSGSWTIFHSLLKKKPQNNGSSVTVGRVHVKVEISEFTDDF